MSVIALYANYIVQDVELLKLLQSIFFYFHPFAASSRPFCRAPAGALEKGRDEAAKVSGDNVPGTYISVILGGFFGSKLDGGCAAPSERWGGAEK